MSNRAATLREIKRIKSEYLLDQMEYELKISNSVAETEALKSCSSFDQMLVILELNNGN